jgi:uncharacterized coiled-coil protein SlyX
MNTIGKILVVLNFVFAIIVGVLLVFDFAARNKWKDAYESLKKEGGVLVASNDVTVKSIRSLASDLTAAKEKIDGLQKDKEVLEIAATVAKDQYDLKITEFELKLKDKDVTLLAIAAAKQRLTEEIEGLNKTITAREQAITKLEGTVKVLTLKALKAEGLASASQQQNENLVEQIRLLTVKIARLEGGLNPDADVIRNPNAPNPPAVLVNGKIEKVDGDLVQIPLGTDHGLNKNNTLDVYRTQPEAKYLGMIRIVDANHHKSVGRFVTVGAQARPQLKEGDLVTSKLSR